MRYHYIAVQVEENGKMYAFMIRVHDNHNLWYELSRIKGICAANILPTKKAAAAVVNAWNEMFHYSGIYMFDTMPDGSPAPF